MRSKLSKSLTGKEASEFGHFVFDSTRYEFLTLHILHFTMDNSSLCLHPPLLH